MCIGPFQVATTRICCDTGVKPVPVGTQLATPPTITNGIPSALTLSVPTLQSPVTHGGLGTEVSVHPATM
jgi:hypothetical protein